MEGMAKLVGGLFSHLFMAIMRKDEAPSLANVYLPRLRPWPTRTSWNEYPWATVQRCSWCQVSKITTLRDTKIILAWYTKVQT